MMSMARLRRFADHVGMLGAGTALRHVLDGRRIAAFREQLGHELFQFGMLKAPLIGTLPISPTVFDEPERAHMAVRASGLAALQAFCMAPDAQHLHLRARLSARLQEIAPDTASRIFVDPPSDALLQRVLREVEPVLATAIDGIGATS
ncbi:MAG: SctK family type III secretion system sorting platform protein [Hydrogenophaga sp.]|nr:SctK family type III secretion system sorting platform protein [Hydrogenophaga sp.]